MFAQILNRTWKVSPEQGAAIVKDALSRRKVLVGGAMVSAGVVLAACGINLATLTPTIAGYIQDGAQALQNGLTALGNLGGNLPAGWAATIQTITGYVTAIKGIASGVSATSLVATVGTDISNYIHDFNAIAEAILANPAVVALVSTTSFGWALSALSVLLPIVEQAVNLVINIVVPPAPVPVPAPAPAAHRMMRMKLAAPMDPATAAEVIHAIAVGAH